MNRRRNRHGHGGAEHNDSHQSEFLKKPENDQLEKPAVGFKWFASAKIREWFGMRNRAMLHDPSPNRHVPPQVGIGDSVKTKGQEDRNRKQRDEHESLRPSQAFALSIWNFDGIQFRQCLNPSFARMRSNLSQNHSMCPWGVLNAN
jgi:hypothetical protein